MFGLCGVGSDLALCVGDIATVRLKLGPNLRCWETMHKLLVYHARTSCPAVALSGTPLGG